MTVISEATLPALYEACREIELDSAGEFTFAAPDGREQELTMADLALGGLQASSRADWLTFVTGEFSDQAAVVKRYPGFHLETAHKVLNDFFDGWEPAEPASIGRGGADA